MRSLYAQNFMYSWNLGPENWLQRPLKQLQLLWYQSALRCPSEMKSVDPEFIGTLGVPVMDPPTSYEHLSLLPPLCSAAYHRCTVVYIGPGSSKILETWKWKAIMPGKKCLEMGNITDKIFRLSPQIQQGACWSWNQKHSEGKKNNLADI